VPYADDSPDDRKFLEQAIDISRHALEHAGKTPFGAVVVIDGEMVGTGTSSVVELHDPTAHAEVMALRAPFRSSKCAWTFDCRGVLCLRYRHPRAVHKSGGTVRSGPKSIPDRAAG
jgi:pyrimidine deaminase RibD-like protein